LHKTALITINADAARTRLSAAEKTFFLSLAQKADLLLAADGGSLLYLQAGILPQKVIGDLDSLSRTAVRRLKAAGVPFLTFPPEKDQSDLQLALEEALGKGAGSVTIYGGSSRTFPLRPDHVLININLLLWGKKQGLKIKWFLNAKTLLFFADAETELEAAPGDTVSLVPFSAKVEQVTLEGFVYPLKAETLYRDDSRGLSNVLKNSRGKIRLGAGLLLVCVIKA